MSGGRLPDAPVLDRRHLGDGRLELRARLPRFWAWRNPANLVLHGPVDDVGRRRQGRGSRAPSGTGPRAYRPSRLVGSCRRSHLRRVGGPPPQASAQAPMRRQHTTTAAAAHLLVHPLMRPPVFFWATLGARFDLHRITAGTARIELQKTAHGARTARGRLVGAPLRARALQHGRRVGRSCSWRVAENFGVAIAKVMRLAKKGTTTDHNSPQMMSVPIGPHALVSSDIPTPRPCLCGVSPTSSSSCPCRSWTGCK